MTDSGPKSVSAQKEHAVAHFFAVLAGLDDIDLLSALMASGIGRLLGMDAVALGILGSDGTGSLRQWRNGLTGDLEHFSGNESQLEAAVTHATQQGDLPFSKILRIVNQGRVVGHIGLARHDSGPLTTESEFLISSVQSLAALLLANQRADEALRQSQQWLRVTLTSIGDAVMTSDSEGRVTFLNPVAEKITGWKTEEAIGQPIQRIFQIINEQTGEPATDIVAQVLREGRTAALANHTSLVTRHGVEVPIEDSAAPIRDTNGNVGGVVLVFHDVTERRRTQEALRESEQRVRRKLDSILSPEGDIGALALADIIDAPALQSLMDQFHDLAGIPMAVVDLNGTVLVGVGWQDICTKFHRVNPETCKHCLESDLELSAGVAAGEFKLYKCKNNMWDVVTPIMVGGKHLGNFFSGQFFFADETPDRELFRSQAKQYGFDEDKYLLALDRVPKFSRSELTTGMTYFTKLADMISKLSYSNIKLARSLAERDVLTESLRLNESRLRLALDAAKLGTWEWDLKTNKTAWSQEVWVLCGIEPHSCEPSFENWLATVYPPDREMTLKNASEAARTGTELNFEYRVLEPDGKTRWLMVRGRPVLDDSGLPVRFVGIVMDINERKRTEAALLQSEKLASVGRMATTIAHEINNPLAAVMNTVFIARNSEDASQSLRQHLDVADAELRRIAQITRQALGFYRESSSPAPVSIKTVVDSTIDLLRGKIKAKEATVTTRFDGDCRVIAVAGELRQVFANLMANSLDAIAQQGTIKLRVSNVVSGKNGDRRIRITIADDGKGIERGLLPRIFEPFFTTKHLVGTGLGLWVSKEIVKKHRGSIHLRSTTSGTHKGTVFSILLPAEVHEPAALATAAAR